jgi:proline iminopeptidase
VNSSSTIPRTEGYVNVLGHKLYYVAFGDPGSQDKILCLHGGPGSPHNYMLSLADLAKSGYYVIFYDQLGVGKSELPKNLTLYTVEHYVEEVEEFRKQMKLEKFHLFGSSWGGFLGIAYALKYQASLKTFISAGGASSTLLTYKEMLRLKSELPQDIIDTLEKYEALGQYEHPEYIKALDVVYHKHLCRLEKWPEDVVYAMNNTSKPVYNTMWGPNEFTMYGNLMYWDVTPKLGSIHTPTLLTCGRYDEVTPKVQRVLREGITGSELEIFEQGSHLTFWEEREKYMKTVVDFLERKRSPV